MYSEVEPGGSSGELISHNSIEECITVLRGRVSVTIDDKQHILNEGDTITFSSLIPHGWENIGDDTLKMIWVVSPPSY